MWAGTAKPRAGGPVGRVQRLRSRRRPRIEVPRRGRIPRPSAAPSAPAHWSVFCLGVGQRRRTAGRGPERPAHAKPGGEDLGERAGLQHDVRPQRPQRGETGAVEGELPVGDVLEDQHPVAPARVHQGLAASQGERPPGRVLELRDHVDELPAGTRPRTSSFELVDEASPSSSIGTPVSRTPGSREGRGDRAEVPRRLDRDVVTGPPAASGTTGRCTPSRPR